MKEIPWIFTSDSVRGIDAGRKTQTRRVVTLNNSLVDWRGHSGAVWKKWWNDLDFANAEAGKGCLHVQNRTSTLCHLIAPRVQPGDVVWVKEAWAAHVMYDGVKPSLIPPLHCMIWYKTGDFGVVPALRGKWRNPMFMPRFVCRKRLLITDVRAERVQDISAEDAIAEGMDMEHPHGLPCPQCDGEGVHPAFAGDYGITEVDCQECNTAVKLFHIRWDMINLKRGYPFSANNWVWPYTFEVID